LQKRAILIFSRPPGKKHHPQIPFSACKQTFFQQAAQIFLPGFLRQSHAFLQNIFLLLEAKIIYKYPVPKL